ncbi:MAG: hypothetical protein ACOY3Z_02125 [Thermodesulfobacteriota bacterium]
MPSRYQLFDRHRLCLAPLSERRHDLALDSLLALVPEPELPAALKVVAERIVRACEKKAAVVLMMGAHVLRSGVQRHIIDLLERGLLSCIAMNGAGVIHDYEFALIGATTESVAHYIRDGRFGLWRETAGLNDLVRKGNGEGLGLGETVGRAIEEGDFPCRASSVLAAAWRCGVPVTVHVGIGHDIVHEAPNCDGAAWGEASYRDFLIFARALEALEDGVVMNFGSAVMAPEVYLKALSMVRNVASQEGRMIRHFTTLVCDLLDLPGEFHVEPARGTAAYYFRPWKTMLVRTVADGGESYYLKGPHRETIPWLWSALGRAGSRMRDDIVR